MTEWIGKSLPWPGIFLLSSTAFGFALWRLDARIRQLRKALRLAKRKTSEVARFNERLLNGMQHGFAMLDVNARKMLKANHYLANLLGIGIDKLLDEGIEPFFGEDYGEFLWEASADNASGQPRAFHYVPSLLPEGGSQYLDINAIDFEEDGRLIRYLFILDVTELKRNQEHGAWLLWDLGERIKELRCMLEISNLALTVEPSLDKIANKIVELIPSGWQCPEIACARIRFEGKEFSWPVFTETKWKQSSEFEYDSGRKGLVEVCYLEQMPESDEGVFSKQERDLIDALGRQIGGWIDRWRTDRDLKARYRLLDRADVLTLPEFISELMKELCDLLECSDGFLHFEMETEDVKYRTIWVSPETPDSYQANGLKGIELTRVWNDLHANRRHVVSQDEFILRTRRDTESESVKPGILLLPLERDGIHFATIGLLGKIWGFDDHDVEQARNFAMVAMVVVERKIEEEKSARLQRYLTNIIDSMPSTIIGVDANECVTQWNRKAEDATGIPAQKAVGRRLSSVFAGLEDELDRIRAAIRRREIQVDPRRHRRYDAETHFEDVMIFPVCEDESAGAVIRLDDITERVRLEELMLQSEKMLSLGGLAAGMAHEINNPLGGIIQTANVIAERIGNAEMPANAKAATQAGTTMEAIRAFMEIRKIPEMLDRIVATGGRAAEIVRNMLDFARKSEQVFSSHDLSRLLDRCVELASSDYDLRKQIDFRQIEIVREYGSDVPPVPCESGKMQQVFLNILRNGAEAMLSGGSPQPRKPQFVLRSSFVATTQMVRIEIEDNGPGMDAATRKRVFEPFFTTKGPKDGTGLGMSVSYFIVTEIHHGRLEVFSEPGSGATFVITIPKEGRAP